MQSPDFDAQPPGRPIMCAIDASDEAGAIVWAGARLAALIDAPLVLFHVARGAGRWHGLDRLLHPERQAGDRREGRILLEQHAAAIPVPAVLEVSAGTAAEEVLMAAEDMDPELLVIGAHSGGALHALLGSVTRDVTRYTSRPTVVVPDHADEHLLRHGPLVCGIDDSEESGRAARLAARLAATLGTELILVSVMDVIPTSAPVAPAGMPAVPTPPDVSRERLDRLRERTEHVADGLRHGSSVPVRTVVDVGDPTARLSGLAEELDAALIAIGSVDRSPLAAALTGSVASDLVGSSSRAVLLVP